MEIDDSKSNGLSARIASLESENEELRRTVMNIAIYHMLFIYFYFRSIPMAPMIAIN